MITIIATICVLALIVAWDIRDLKRDYKRYYSDEKPLDPFLDDGEMKDLPPPVVAVGVPGRESNPNP